MYVTNHLVLCLLCVQVFLGLHSLPLVHVYLHDLDYLSDPVDQAGPDCLSTLSAVHRLACSS